MQYTIVKEAFMRGIPRDFDELVQRFSSVIETAGTKNVPLIAYHLTIRGSLGKYRPPRETTLPQLLGYVGITFHDWKQSLRREELSDEEGLLPEPLRGLALSTNAVFDFYAVEHLRHRRLAAFPDVARRNGFLAPVPPGFPEFLSHETKLLLAEFEATEGLVFDIPSHLPQSPQKLYDHAALVVRAVRQVIRFGIHFEDAVNSVWEKLLSSDILVKFVRSCPKRTPPFITAEEAADYLGVPWNAWRRMLNNYVEAPSPISGDPSSRQALFRSEDVFSLDTKGYFSSKRGLRKPPEASVTPEQFRSYLAYAAQQHAKNLLRTHTRRHNREHTLRSGIYLSDEGPFFSPHASQREDANSVSWEDGLLSVTPRADEALEMKQRLGVAATVREAYEALLG